MGGLERGGEPGQGQGGQQQAEVAQGHVVVVAEQQQLVMIPASQAATR